MLGKQSFLTDILKCNKDGAPHSVHVLSRHTSNRGCGACSHYQKSDPEKLGRGRWRGGGHIINYVNEKQWTPTRWREVAWHIKQLVKLYFDGTQRGKNGSEALDCQSGFR